MVKEIVRDNAEMRPNSREIAVLKEHFASCFNGDGSFDIGKFKERLGGEVAISNEGYELDFLGKNYARLLAAVDTTTVVVPDEEHNAKEENAKSGNLYISGDNLDALKHLLKSYAGRVKCIYIDPPYNTGSDGFVYNDSFDFSAAEIAAKLNLDEEKAQRILDFTKRGSASHSAWLMFMLPRLVLARDLLSKDGVIFISIDDNEQANLKLLCDDVFGEENFLAILPRRTKSGGGSAADAFAVEHDYVCVYARSASALDALSIPFTEEYLKRYNEVDDKGRYFWDTMERSSTKTKPYLITAPDGSKLAGKWFRSEETFKEDLKYGEVRFLKKKDGTWSVQFKQRLAEGRKLRSLITEDLQIELSRDEFKSYSDDLVALGIAEAFSYPKTVRLVQYLLQVVKNGDVVMDFFSGSATTAEAVLRLNSARMAQNGDQIKFIMVQIAEDLDVAVQKAQGDNKKAAQKAIDFLDEIKRPHTLDQIGIERIRRAAAKIAAENPLTAKTMDLGFKHYTLKEPSAEQLEKIEAFDPAASSLLGTDDMLREFGAPTVLATWMVHDGYGLTAAATPVDFDGYTAYWKDRHLYLIGAGLPDNGIIRLVEKYETDGDFNPVNVVVFGYSFAWTTLESLRVNLAKLRDGAKSLAVNIDVRY